MNRNGTALLAATLFASLLLSPGVRPAREAGKALSIGTAPPQSAIRRNSEGTLPGCGTAECRKRIHDEIRKEGREEYRKEIEDLITNLCQTTENGKQGGKLPQKSGQEECRKPENFIIALAPDPVHTHQALQFDRTVDVIEEAVQDEGYIFDRAVMPWDTKVHPDPDDYESRLEGEEYQKGREELPGLIGFRGDSGKYDDSEPKKNGDSEKKNDDSEQKWLFVLVVAETPTGGVREQQFENAIGIIKSPTRVDSLPKKRRVDKQKNPSLRILGPTFSGSLHSLGKLLTCGTSGSPNPCYPLVSIHSGTVSSRDAIVEFDEKKQIPGVHFVSLHESDEVMIERFVEFFTGTGYVRPGQTGRHYATEDIAILAEDETTYGAFRDNVTPGKDCETEVSNQACVLRLYFPREISQLRAAYQDSVTTTPSTGQGRSASSDTLPPNFSVPGSDDDTVAAYSAKQTPLSQESVLLAIVSELQKHSIKFVILRATDPIDSLFLSQFLRAAYPQGRVVTIDADLLFRRVASDPQMHGVLALSTYSLAPKANHYFHSYEQHYVERIFASSSQVGTYNATRSLLTAWVDKNTEWVDEIVKKKKAWVACEAKENAAAGDCRHKLEAHEKDLQLNQYGWPYECKKKESWVLDALPCEPKYDAPPVRLLALGRDSYWPVAALGPYPGEQQPSTLPRVAGQFAKRWERVTISNSWRVIQLFVILVALLFSGAMWRSSVLGGTGTALAPALPDARSTVTLIMSSTLMLMLLILLWPSVKYAEAGSHSLNLWLWCVAVLLFLSTLADLVSRACLAKKQPPGIRWRSWALVLLFVSFCILLLWQGHFWQPFDDSAFAVRFTTVRATQLTSGLSFIMPILFFVAVWLWWGTRVSSGFALLDDRRPRLPAAMREPGVQGLSEEAFPALKSVRRLGPVQFLGYLLLLVGTLAICRWMGWWVGDHKHPLMSLETPFLDHCMWFFLYLAAGGVILATLRLRRVWLAVRRLLVAIESFPLRKGFKIEGFAWKPIWRLGAGSVEDLYRIFSRKKEALDCVRNTLPIKNDRVNEELKKTMDLFRAAKALQHPNTLDWWRRRRLEVALIQQFGKVQEAIAEVAGAALDYLAWTWSLQKEGPASASESLTGLSENIRACERFVCLVFVDFLLVMLVRIRTLIFAIGGMYVLLLIGITQYPFEPKSFLQVVLVVLLGIIVAMVGAVFAQMHRDSVLSNLTDTTPGELGVDFWIRIVSFSALPIFTLLASQFPSINRFVYSWLQPGLQALNH